MSDITAKFTFTAAGTSPVTRSLGPNLLVQTTGNAVQVYGSNLPDDAASWQLLGAATGYTPTAIATGLAWLKMVSAVAGTAAISAADSSASSGASAGLTDAQLRAAAVPVSSDALGLPTDATAASDAASVGLIALAKRALGNWTMLLTRLPALVSGRIPVDASASIQLGGGAISATTQRVTLASDGPGVASLTSISTRSDRLAPLSTTCVDETTSGTTYLLKQGASADVLSWVVVKIVVASGVTTMTYAGSANNAGQASASAAWTARASLVYGLPQEA